MRCIAIDLMGSTALPAVIARSVIASADPSVVQFLFLAQEGTKLDIPPPHKVIYVPDAFEPGDLSLHVARRKRTSLTEAVHLLARGEAEALITAGDTGTLVAAARLFLKPTLASRTTALMTKLPTSHSEVLVGDVGAHVHAKARHFVDFAELGVALLQQEGQKKIRMALLNIGEEPSKGPEEWVKAYRLLAEFSSKHPGLEFMGNIEASDLFTSDVQLLITEALAGNILLKTAEGVAKLVMKEVPELSTKPWLDGSSYPGAILAGLSAPIIKVHGYAHERGFVAALNRLLS